MSLEQYQELAKQETNPVPNSIFYEYINNIKLLTSIFHSKNTELETLLIHDTETFTSPITNSHSFTEKYPSYGDIFTLKVPHPLRTQLNNSAISTEIRKRLESKISKTPVLIFIHGLGGNLQQFDEIISNFNGITDLFAIDLPGSGLSKPKDGLTLSLQNLTMCVKEALEKNGFIGRDLIFIAHSYGTQVALKLSTLIPNVKGLILFAPPKIPMIRTWKQKIIVNILFYFPFVFELFRRNDRTNNITSKSMTRLFSNPNTPDILKFKQFRFNLLTNSTNFLNHLINWEPLTISEVIDSSQIISNNKGRILIIDGDHDKVTHEGGKSYYDLIGMHGSNYKILENSGHNFILESASVLNPILEGFLVDVDETLKKGYVDMLRGKLSEVEVL